MWKHRGTTLVYSYEMMCNFSGTTLCPWKTQRRWYRKTYRFQEGDAANETSWAPFGPNRKTRPSPSSQQQKYNIHVHEIALIQSTEENLTARLSPSSFRPVSFKKETMNDNTLKMLAVMSTRWGMPKSFAKMAFSKAGRDDIQSRVSAPFSQ